MIIDARTLEPGTRIEADLCIVGSGPAGLCVAREFLDTGVRVVMLEAGGLEETAESQDFYAGENAGLDYDLAGSRYRMFGGSSSHWGGYTAPFDPADFDAHPWIPLSGWPIGWGDVQPYYGRAAAVLGFEEREFDLAHWTEQGLEAVRFPENTVRNKIWRFNRLRFGEAFREPLERAGNLQVLLQAPVTRVELNESRGAVASLRASPAPGVEITVVPRRCVIACGGLETPRLLLTAGPGHTPVVDNPNLGRYFMEHVHVTWSIDLALFGPAGASRLYQQCGVIDDCCEVRAFFVLADRLRWQHELTNVALKVHHEAQPHPVAEAAGRLAGRLSDRSETVHPGSLSIMAEQVPNPASRMTVTEARDRLGVPRLRLDWRATALDNHAALRSVQLLAAGLGRAGAGRLRPHPQVRALAHTTDFGGWALGGQHHMGTTRMAADPRNGVVDGDCKVHGLENLYLAGSSVFATGGSANPTLTLMALAIRLADHLAPGLRS